MSTVGEMPPHGPIFSASGATATSITSGIKARATLSAPARQAIASKRTSGRPSSSISPMTASGSMPGGSSARTATTNRRRSLTSPANMARTSTHPTVGSRTIDSVSSTSTPSRVAAERDNQAWRRSQVGSTRASPDANPVSTTGISDR
ncbi:MAG: hypothetical protein IPO44_14965 [Candidatus Microthrix sp.]|nr:hypothetical protein [Candidatus Microthrix sp.]MBK9560791.1 hypothetical protein [Candidatus Microthrix sp.]